MNDLLGCICLLDTTCQRNCRVHNQRFQKPKCCKLRVIRFDPLEHMNDVSQVTREFVEKAEQRWSNEEVVALEAYSNGRVNVWFQ